MGVNRHFYKEIVVLPTLYGTEALSKGAAERKRLHVVELRCLRSKCGVA